ncbi:flagellar export protein FliJ [Virgibacillus profundi]|uniref:Flagellar FliJ protein n=1 Tax=Virgibacillus profundi TaxID=2024555 RepID=A0A2A2IEM5_9BACI|nr:flagellar export protein FliJ [Virgibacillus profundi]PAV30002.1 flagellar export protein FliJ [Virgibacillus profundi]PXY54175.1 flagellar export protein FliJ [Virgibacillus profundi]
MAETIVLSKILNVREKEKNDAQKAYHQSMDFFEKVATQLYTLLRKKESAEESYEEYISTTTSLDKIREQIAYIDKLNTQIMSLQQDVQNARTAMESKQLQLTDAHVEVKKFEKIIDIRKKAKADTESKMENLAMDEISIQQYLTNKNR